MFGTATKKMLNMLILDILRKHSDSEHPLQQQDIIDLLESEYGAACERRAVKSNIVSLREMGFKIAEKQGYYLAEREFTDAELRLLIDSVFTSGAVTDKEAHGLVKKLEKFANRYFTSHVSHMHSASSGKNTDNQQVMESIAAIDTAISKGKKISFSYVQYGIDLKLHPKRDMKYTVSPYQMISTRGKYYLIGNFDGYENISHYRLDRIKDVEILRENRRPMRDFRGYENGFDVAKYLAEHIYMYAGESEHVTFRTDEGMIDALVDTFGKDMRIRLGDKDEIIVTLKSNPDAFFFWALQYGQNVEVLEPAELRERIRRTAYEMYKKHKGSGREEHADDDR